MGKRKTFDLGEREKLETKYHDYEFPKVSVIIPTYNCSEAIALTLESVLEQHYPDFEVVIVDGGSSDRTIEVIKSYREERIRLVSHTDQQRYALLNKGITQSTGDYINVLFPGDFYLYKYSLHHVMTQALEGEKPHLVYGGALLRDGRHEPQILYLPLTPETLQQGEQPTSMQACWFSKETFKKLGKLDTNLTIRGGFEFFCRFIQEKEMKWTQTSRVVTDFDASHLSRGMIFDQFMETLKIIYTYFGIVVVCKWLLFHQKEWGLIFRDALRSLRGAFLGR